MAGPIRVAFLGNDDWSVPALDALARAPRVEIVLVLTGNPRPVRRGSGTVATPVAGRGRALGLPLFEAPTVRSGVGWDRLQDARPDVLAVVAYGELLPAAVLDLAPLGAINLHFSLLPRWRGAAPVQRAILAGDDRTGVTTMLMDEGLDTGPILERREEPIGPLEDAGSLGARLAEIGGPMLVAAIAGRHDGSIVPRPQTGGVTLASKITGADRAIVWSEPAPATVRRVRALSPRPGATTRLGDRSLTVFRAEALPGPGEPGVVSTVDAAGVVVGAGAGSVRLVDVAPAGRRRMSASAFANGARLRPGDRAG
jgi:methionyl-tRNA formyltransferase